MLDKVIEQLGQATQYKIAEAVGNLNEKSEAERVALVDLISDTHDSFVSQLEETQKSLTEAINDVDTRREALYVDESQQIVEKLNQLEVMAAQLSTIKDGEDGEKGEQGLQGEPGLDRPLLEPVQIVDKDYPKSTLGLHNGGLWISTKDSVGCPESDPHAWSCILDSMTTMSIDLQEDHTFKLSVRMATGKLIEDSFKIPYPEHKGIWEEGEYKQGQIVTKGSSFWQAMEDTAGEPPGNGWKQILTAPRGKVGPAGKSIEGPQGKPGRNGVDGKDAEIDWEAQKLFVEGIIYTDNRSASYPLRSFRGWYSQQESYSVGDLVRENNDLVVVTKAIPAGSKYSSIAFEHTEVMITSGSGASTAAKTIRYMLWKGMWAPGFYGEGDTVTDDGWTMVVVNPDGTTERPAPQNVGPVKNVYDGTLTPTVVNVQQSVSGTRYFNSAESVSVLSYRINTVSGYDYSVYSVRDPDGDNIISELLNFTATATGWERFTIPNTVIPAGFTFELLAIAQAPPVTPVTWTGTWEYTTPGNPKDDPASGEWFQPDNDIGQMRINKTDSLLVDKSADLEAVALGDNITDGIVTWTVQGITDNITWMAFDVSPSSQSFEAEKEFTFTTIPAIDTTIGIDTDYWLNEGSLNQGIIGTTYSDLVLNDNAYGVDIEVQEISISPDWDVVTASDVTTSSAEITAVEREWIKESSSPFTSSTVTTADDQWVEVGRLATVSGEAIRGKVSVEAKRTDAVDYHASEWAIIAWNDGGLIVDEKKDFEVGSNHVDLQVVADGNDLVINVRGETGETWDVNGTAFYRSIA